MNRSEAARPQKPRILVVEDEIIVAFDIGAQLVKLGYEQAGHATRGEEAIALCEEGRPDLVLMDIRLAGAMDGIAAAEAIRAKFSLPVVFLTAFAEDDTLVRARLAEPFGFIIKPFTERDLRTVLEMALYKHEAESRLRQSERRYRTLIHWSPDPLAVYRDGTLLYVNPAAVEMIGAESASPLVGRPILDFIHPDFHDLARARAKDMAAGAPGAPRVEMTFLRGDGTPFAVEVQSTSIDYDGAPAIHSAMRDITQRKQEELARDRLENQLRESQKMQAVGSLASGIAHDFNNLLAVILANADTVRSDLTASPTALDYLEEIRKAATRGRDLVQQILSFSRTVPPKRSPVDLSRVVEESARLLRSVIPAHLGLDVRCEAPRPIALGDATQIQQVVINLVTNAMQAMGAVPGRIELSLDAVRIDAALVEARPSLLEMRSRKIEQALRLRVRDEGRGMDETLIQRIFDPFFTTKPLGEGTGLGLSVVHGIVLGHGGVILVDSQPGRGSTFSVYFPASLGPAQTTVLSGKSSTAPAESTEGSGGRILYIDDQAPLVLAITRLLERRGHSAKGFTDAREAIETLRLDPFAFDLVITDHNMPGMSGLEVASEVRAIRPDLPVTVTSGLITPALKAQAEEAGVRELILKGDPTRELLEMVRRLVGTRAGKPDSS